MKGEYKALLASFTRYVLNSRDFSESEIHYKECVKINLETNIEKAEAIGYHQLGILSEEQRDLKNAEKWYLKAFEMRERLGDKHGLAQSYMAMGALEMDKGNLVQAGQWMIRSIPGFREMNNAEAADYVTQYLKEHIYGRVSGEGKVQLKRIWKEIIGEEL